MLLLSSSALGSWKAKKTVIIAIIKTIKRGDLKNLSKKSLFMPNDALKP
jgi:hypothetical protein